MRVYRSLKDVPPDFGPSALTINDPNGVCIRDIGHHKQVLDFNLRSWDLDSPLARPRLGHVAT